MLKLSFKQTNAEFMVRIASTLIFNQLVKENAKIVSIRDITEGIQYGHTEKATESEIGPKYVRITDLKDGNVNWKTVPYCKCDNPEQYLLKQGDLIFARTGATTGKTHLFREVPPHAVFASYLIRVRPTKEINPEYLYFFFQSDLYWSQVSSHKEGSAQPNVNGQKLSNIELPIIDGDTQKVICRFLAAVRARQDGSAQELPELPYFLNKQRSTVERIETLARKVNEMKSIKQEIGKDLDKMLLSAYHSIADNADRKPLEEVAPLTRRPANVSLEENYPQVSVRSFGRGTFHKPELDGSEITWQKPYLVKSGDILISNIKAWEGAIAVASERDDGRYGSHRYLTCVPIPNVATSRFVCFHLLTSEGLYEVGQASPGSADRNRTLGAKALMQIPIPTPPIEKQLWFDNLYAKVASLRELQSATGEELSALLPSVLDRAFKGAL